jgi:hypothetical protein
MRGRTLAYRGWDRRGWAPGMLERQVTGRQWATNAHSRTRQPTDRENITRPAVVTKPH